MISNTGHCRPLTDVADREQVGPHAPELVQVSAGDRCGEQQQVCRCLCGNACKQLCILQTTAGLLDQAITVIRAAALLLCDQTVLVCVSGAAQVYQQLSQHLCEVAQHCRLCSQAGLDRL